ncbi:hypothetical protein HUN39_09865 [Methylocystis sp. FS]|uniref:hypothetical protein n=1 Tax=Methylocystis silviterrae TaxID=2743612 RepID=UPI001583CEB8|nr:hypothetical protein [Methylocystis silviterrae]NUJ80332.1 hypothetical protein [Methylocystis silviterrae]
MMAILNRKTLGAAQLVAGTALLVLIGPPSAERGPSAAWAMEARYDEPQQIARRETSRYRGLHRPSSEEEAGDASSASSSGALAAALASCEKDSSGTAGLTLPGAKGAIRLDSCYRGREQFVCSLNTLLDEAKKLNSDFGHIIEAKYPAVGSVDAICRIRPDALSADLTKAGTFAARFKDLRIEYDRRISCAMKVEQNLKQVNLGDMPHSADILKSMNDTLEADLKDVAATRQQIFDLNEKMQASQKAIVTIEKLRPTMCLSTSAPKPAESAEKPVSGGQ